MGVQEWENDASENQGGLHQEITFRMGLEGCVGVYQIKDLCEMVKEPRHWGQADKGSR